MIRPRLRLHDYLQHILAAIGRIESHATGFDRAASMSDAKTRDAVVRQFQIIGEAAQNVRQQHHDFVAAHPEAPWRAAYGMRNALAHGYYDVDLLRVWTTVQNDLPAFAEQIRAMLREMDESTATDGPIPGA